MNRYKKLACTALALLCAAGMTACADASAKTSEEAQRQSQNTQDAPLAENESQLVGQVTSIAGNQVVLALGTYTTEETTANGQNETQETASANGQEAVSAPGETEASSSSEKKRGQRSGSSGASGETASGVSAQWSTEGAAIKNLSASAPAGSMPEGMEPPEGMTPPDGAEGSPDSAGAEQASGQQSTAGTFTENGESTTLLVPVGLTLTGSGSGQRSSDFSSITQGMLLRVTLRETDGKQSVVAVRVLKATA